MLGRQRRLESNRAASRRPEDAVNDYAKNGWQLVSASFVVEANSGSRTVGHLIFMKK
jgi:hypothetical protein